MFDHGKVVGDENQRQPHFFLHLLEQVDHLRLNGNVERRHRLVTDNQLGLQDQGASNADALALAAGKFVGVAVDLAAQQADFFHHGVHALLDFFVAEIGIVGAQRLGNDAADAHAGIERCQRVLEDHLDVFALEPHGFGRQADQLFAVKQNAAGAGFDQADNGAGKGGFAAAGFADHAEGFAGFEIERYAVDGFEGGGFLPEHRAVALDVEVGLHVAYLQ